MKKGGLKYKPLATSDICQGEVLLPGRHACNCEATKHALINNCLNCGRIVCEQESSGPCFTCNKLVCTPKEMEQICRMSKSSYKLYHKLMNQGKEPEDQQGNSLQVDHLNENLTDSIFQNALKHRDKLLEYDQTVERRTKVIDDQSDYFQTNSSWLSKKERALLNKKKDKAFDAMHSRKNATFTFDFGEREVIEEKPTIDFDVDDLLQSNISIFDGENNNILNIPPDYFPSYEESNEVPSKNKNFMSIIENVEHLEDKLKVIRIQDRELQEMSDEGKCLSLHQPYASLVVRGIKKHEGRVWYTSYRGRLWIHSAAKVPSAKEITMVQNFYKEVVGKCKFPETYPTGCLLGCVDLVDCLPQEEYKEKYPNGKIASPYVFMCENPQELNLKFPMQGKHKIFKLDSNIHQAAKKTLKKIH